MKKIQGNEDTIIEIEQHAQVPALHAEENQDRNNNNQPISINYVAQQEGNHISEVPGNDFICSEAPNSLRMSRLIEDSFNILQTVDGLSMKYDKEPFKLMPIINLNFLGACHIRNPLITVSKKRKSGRYFCCFPASSSVVNEFTFQKGTDIIMTTTLPVLSICPCCQTMGHRSVEVRSPLCGEQIGNLCIAFDIRKPIQLTNCLTQKRFKIQEIKGEEFPSIQIQSRSNKAVVAIGKATGGIKTIVKYRSGRKKESTQWNEFQLVFTSDTSAGDINLSSVDRALILTAFNVWIAEMKERESQKKGITMSMICLYLLVFLLTIGVFAYCRLQVENPHESHTFRFQPQISHSTDIPNSENRVTLDWKPLEMNWNRIRPIK